MKIYELKNKLDILDAELRRENDEHCRTVESIEDEIIAVQLLITERKLKRKRQS